MDYYNISTTYTDTVMERTETRFAPGACKILERMLDVISRELMPEMALPVRTNSRQVTHILTQNRKKEQHSMD